MKVLHINQSDIVGGAAIAGYRLHQGLLSQGVDSHLLVSNKKTTSDLVEALPNNRYRLENQIYRFTGRAGLNNINSIGSFDIPQHPLYQAANILNLHNLHGNYFSYLALAKLTQSKPAIFTLHDMWSFSGHCAYSYDCDRWQNGCGHCPNLDTYPGVARDNTALEWKLKNWVYERSNLAIVTLSYWLTQNVRQSMLKRFPIHHIPNGIDTEAYQPLDPDLCRAVLGIPARQNILMLGAASLSDPRKGSGALLRALANLPKSLKAETILLTIGDGADNIESNTGISTLNLGYVSGDRLKAIAYSAADLFLFPTLADNLPLVLQESMACGTPMISFNIGGVPDLVRPNETGYLATPGNIDEFCTGIVQLLEDKALRQTMKQRCREIAVTEYSLELQAKRYIQLYQKTLANTN
jgi:glycosyltransferase involved in cell wall biosynthesis